MNLEHKIDNLQTQINKQNERIKALEEIICEYRPIAVNLRINGIVKPYVLLIHRGCLPSEPSGSPFFVVPQVNQTPFPLMHFYYVRINNRQGAAESAMLAIRAAIGESRYRKFYEEQGTKGYQWSNYLSRTIPSKHQLKFSKSNSPLSYEACTINHNGEQIAEVYRSANIKAIQYLSSKYGTPKQSSVAGYDPGRIIATVAKKGIKRITPKSKRSSK